MRVLPCSEKILQAETLGCYVLGKYLECVNELNEKMGEKETGKKKLVHLKVSKQMHLREISTSAGDNL